MLGLGMKGNNMGKRIWCHLQEQYLHHDLTAAQPLLWSMDQPEGGDQREGRRSNSAQSGHNL